MPEYDDASAHLELGSNAPDTGPGNVEGADVETSPHDPPLEGATLKPTTLASRSGCQSLPLFANPKAKVLALRSSPRGAAAPQGSEPPRIVAATPSPAPPSDNARPLGPPIKKARMETASDPPGPPSGEAGGVILPICRSTTKLQVPVAHPQRGLGVVTPAEGRGGEKQDSAFEAPKAVNCRYGFGTLESKYAAMNEVLKTQNAKVAALTKKNKDLRKNLRDERQNVQNCRAEKRVVEGRLRRAQAKIRRLRGNADAPTSRAQYNGPMPPLPPYQG